MLPRLNALRWGVQSLQALQAKTPADGEALAAAMDTLANQISTQPDSGSTNIATVLANRQADATQRFAAYRRESAIKDAKERLSSPVTTDALGVWQRLSEWTNHPTDGQQVLELRQQLRSKLLEDEVAKFADAAKASLQKFGGLTNVALRQAGYFRAMESVVAQRLTLLDEPDAPASAVNALADLSAAVEALIKAEAERQKRDDAERAHGYQQWALGRIAAFRNDFSNAQRPRFGESVRGPTFDYRRVRDALTKNLLQISPAYLDTAVMMLYKQAFDEGWSTLGGKDEKYLQTEVGNADAVTPKKTPQNYQEQP